VIENTAALIVCPRCGHTGVRATNGPSGAGVLHLPPTRHPFLAVLCGDQSSTVLDDAERSARYLDGAGAE